MMTLDAYLANHSNYRQADKAIKQWYVAKYGAGYIEKTKDEWDKIIVEFYGKSEPAEKIMFADIPEEEPKNAKKVKFKEEKE